MRRILLLLAMVVLTVVILAMSVTPAFAIGSGAQQACLHRGSAHIVQHVPFDFC